MYQQQQIIYQRVYYDYFKDLIAIQDYIVQNPIYTDSYYDGLTQIFSLISSNHQHQVIINHSEYIHKIHKQFTYIKLSKITEFKLFRNVKITNKGLIQCNNKKGSEKLLKPVEMISQIVDSDEIKGKECKIAFIGKKQKISWVFFENRNDAITARDYCLINAAINNLKYNVAGFLHFLIIRFTENGIIKLAKQIQKASEEMAKLFAIEQNYSQSLSLFSPVQIVRNSPEVFQSSKGFQTQEFNSDYEIEQLVSNYLNEILQKAIDNMNEEENNMNIEEENSQIINVSWMELSNRQKSKYSDYHSTGQEYQ